MTAMMTATMTIPGAKSAKILSTRMTGFAEKNMKKKRRRNETRNVLRQAQRVNSYPVRNCLALALLWNNPHGVRYDYQGANLVTPIKETMGKILDIDGWQEITVMRLSGMLKVRPMEIGKAIKAITGKKTVRHYLSHAVLLADMKTYKDWESISNWFFAEALDVSEQTISTIKHKWQTNKSFGVGRGFWSKRRTAEEKKAYGSAPRKKKAPIFNPIVAIEKPVKIKVDKPVKKSKEKKEYDLCFCGECPLGKQSDECYQIELAGRPRIDPSFSYLNSKSVC